MRMLSCALLFALCAPALSAQTSHFSAYLTGDQEVPPVTTNAAGWAVVSLNEASGQVQIFVEAQQLTARAAHMHLAPRGQNGSVIVPLSGGPTRWQGTGNLNAAQITALKGDGTYINLHTSANPGGEIRGQVVTSTATRFVAQLDGQQEVPPNRSTATGVGVAFLHEPDNRLVYTVSSRGLSNVTAAHVHIAPRGTNGGVVFPLNGSAGQYCGVSPRLSSASMRALLSDGLYFNIHTRSVPGGEIRGQILAGDPGAYTVALDGTNEVPPVRTLAKGHACLELAPDGALRYVVETTGIAASAAHIHFAPVGNNGPVVFPLTGGPTRFQGVTGVLTATQLQDLRQGNYYINVHSRANPGGEIRGQIGRPAVRPSTYGGACPGTGSRLAEIGADGIPCPGDSFDIRLFDGRPSSVGVLLIGASRDAFGVIPLPFDLAVLGAPGCFLLTPPTLVVPLPIDGNGCARAAIGIPADFSFVGANVFSQWLIVDQGANRSNLVTSNGLDIRIQ